MDPDSPTAAGPASPRPMGGVDILEIFDLGQLQELQDRFAAATGVASIITRPDGTPVTRPSNFCRLCSEVVRATEKGLLACMHSDAIVGAPDSEGPTVRKCLSGALWDAGASISVKGEPVANWLIGQVRTSTDDDDATMLAFAREIGADEAEFAAALAEVPLMSEKRFRVIADFLFVMAMQLSASAYQNLEKTRLLADMDLAAVSLVHSEQRYRQLFERSPVGYQSLDADGRFILVNSAWLALLGYSEEEVVGAWFGDFLAPAYRDAFRERFPIFKAAGSIHSEFEMLSKDGAIRFVGFDGVIGRDAHGEFQQTHCVLKDITESHKAEQALAESEERLRRALTEAPFPVMLHAEDGEVIQVNRAWQEITGYSLSDIPTVGDWTESAYGARAVTIKEYIDDLYKLEHRKDEGEFTIRTKSGEARVWEFSTTPLGAMPDGRRLMMTAAQDVTERKRAAKALLDSERVYRNLFDSTEVAMFRSRLDGSETLNVNEKFLELVGRTREEVVGRPSIAYWADPDDREEMLRILETDGCVVDFEYRMLNGLGESRDCITSLNVYPEEGVLAGSILDVTHMMQAERALVASNERLESVLKSITETMGKVVETRDPYTQGHQTGVAKLGRQISEEMGLPQAEIDSIEMAALVHDIGKLSVPTEILTKPGHLSEVEFALIKEHSTTGYEILKDVDFGWPIADVILQHHERMDGSGYPNALSGSEISMAARIIAVADVVEAMASYRPYRAALGIDLAVAEIRGHAEKYDARVVGAFLKLYDEGRLEL